MILADGAPPCPYPNPDPLRITLTLPLIVTLTAMATITLGVEGATTINAWGPTGEALVEMADPIILSMGVNVSWGAHDMFLALFWHIRQCAARASTSIDPT